MDDSLPENLANSLDIDQLNIDRVRKGDLTWMVLLVTRRGIGEGPVW